MRFEVLGTGTDGWGAGFVVGGEGSCSDMRLARRWRWVHFGQRMGLVGGHCVPGGQGVSPAVEVAWSGFWLFGAIVIYSLVVLGRFLCFF